MHKEGGKGGRGGMKQHPRGKFLKNLLIKMQNRWTPLAIFPETLDPPPRNFGKNIPYPLPWIFNPCASILIIVKPDLTATSK
jgi:hypothetical protein